MSRRPVVDEEKCITCGLCKEVCPADPNCYEIADKAKVVHPESCTECNACVDQCPTQAIELKE